MPPGRHSEPCRSLRRFAPLSAHWRVPRHIGTSDQVDSALPLRSHLPGAGRLDPEQAYQEVLQEEQAKGVSPAVAEGRAKAARVRAEKGSPNPKEAKWWPGAQPHLEGDGAAAEGAEAAAEEAPAEVEEPAAEAPAEQPAAEAPAEQPAAEAPAEQPAAEAPAEQPAAEAPAEQPAAEAPAEQPAAV